MTSCQELLDCDCAFFLYRIERKKKDRGKRLTEEDREGHLTEERDKTSTEQDKIDHEKVGNKDPP